MEVYLCAREDDLFNAWKLLCGHIDFVTPTRQDIMSIKADALVSPANSFGFMTGGIDLHYKNYLGQGMEDAIRRRISLGFNHELLVGQATSVELGKTPPLVNYKYVIAAPTMRVPENISHTINAYLATKAALIEAVMIGVESIVFPGMGTGTGCLASMDCAKQVSAAIGDVLITKKAYRPVKDMYEEQAYMRDHIVSTKWMKMQYED